MLQARNIYFLIALIVALSIGFKSLDYFTPQFDVGYLNDKSDVFDFYQYFLYSHIIGAPIAFIIGLIQFSFKQSKWHKYLGYIYVVSVLLLAAPGGLVMSFFAIGGLPSIINFTLLSGLWFYFTSKAFVEIKRKNFIKHQEYMIRSFILANSAILIRLLSFVNNQTQLMDTTSGYILIGWLSWLPALLIFELWNNHIKSLKST